MTVAAKICGINSAAALDAAVAGGAAMVGFVFFPRSPRHVTLAQAADLAARAPSPVKRVAVLVDPTDAQLDELLAAVPIEVLQLHGHETPERVAAIARRTKRVAMKAIAVETAADLDAARAFEPVAEWLLFDAKPPKSLASALPGGNAIAFDWTLLRGRIVSRPWVLSGGLTPENVAGAIAASGAAVVDVSSGVEDRPGMKSPARIRAFLAAVQSAGAPAARKAHA